MRKPTTSRVTSPEAAPPCPRRADRGDTLVEVLLAVVILSIASVALIIAFGTSIKASAEHRNLANFDTAFASSDSTVTSLVQGSASSYFGTCAPVSAYPSSSALSQGLATNYVADITAVEYWNGTQFSATCSSSDNTAPQLITVTITNTSTGFVQTNEVVVDNPSAIQAFQTSNGTAYQVIFVNQPSGAVINQNFTTQPTIEIVDNTGKLVTSDLSPVTLAIVPGTGSSGAVLSDTCNGIETSGVVTFSGCSINELGAGYQLIATDPGLVSATSSPFSVTPVQLAAPTITSVTPSLTTAGALTVNFTGSPNAPNGQNYLARACTDSAMSQNCQTQNGFVSGSDFTGLTPGTNYYVALTATASSGYLAATTPPTGPTPATVQLTAPGTPTLAYGASGGSLNISFTPSTNAASSQSYTVDACTNSNMSSQCVTNTNFTSGSDLTGLANTLGQAGTTYYVTVTANASTGYLVSGPSTQASHPDTVQLASPTQVSANFGTVAGSLAVNFNGASPVPSQTYTVNTCTDPGMSVACVSVGSYTSGANVTGLSYSVGSVGTLYYATVSENGSPGYLASAPSTQSSNSDTSQVGAPTGVSVATSTTSANAIDVTFSPPSGVTPSSYTAVACTDFAMTQNCVSQANYASGSELGGLTGGLSYYATVTAQPPAGFVANTSAVSSSAAVASTQLSAPTITAVTPSTVNAGAIKVTFNPSSPAVAGQTYTLLACTNFQMTQSCVTQLDFVSGTDLTGLTPGGSYYVTVSADPSTGYIGATSAVVGPTSASTQLSAPTGVALGYGSSAGSLRITYSGSSNAPGGETYSLLLCTNAAMNAGCTSNANFPSGSSVTGLAYTAGQAGNTYYATVTANATNGYIGSAPSAVASGSDTSAESVPQVVTSTAGDSSGQISVEVASPSTPTPSSYTCRIYSNASLSVQVTSGSCSASGFTTYSLGDGYSGTTVYVVVTANSSSAAYASTTASPVAGSVT